MESFGGFVVILFRAVGIIAVSSKSLELSLP